MERRWFIQQYEVTETLNYLARHGFVEPDDSGRPRLTPEGKRRLDVLGPYPGDVLPPWKRNRS